MKHNQHGLSFYGVLVLLVLVVFFGILGFKIGPVYLDNKLMSSAVQEILDGDLSNATRNSVREELGKAMTINNISPEARNALVVNKLNDRFTVTANYDVRIDLFYNIDVLVSFEDELRQP
jgi:hypothetical protein